MTAAATPHVTLVHRLPGRVRLRLSLPPRNPRRLLATVESHAGLRRVTYTPATRSVLALFDPARMPEEEIILRVALSLALDAGGVPVHVATGAPSGHVTPGAWAAALALGVAAFFRFAGSPRAERWAWIAGGATAGAVAYHGWHEVRERGYFDPEVLSLGYLFMAFMRGNVLPASAVTWAATFGRHLLAPQHRGIVVRPVQAHDHGGTPRYEVTVQADAHQPGGRPLVTALRGLVNYMMTGSAGGRDLLGDLQRMSHLHGEVLEGMGWMPNGIPVKFT